MRILMIEILQTKSLSSKSHKPFMVYVCSQTWIKTCDNHINPEVELEVVYQQRIGNVSGYHERFLVVLAQIYT